MSWLSLKLIRWPGEGQLERDGFLASTEEKPGDRPSHSQWLPLPSRPVCSGTLPEAKEQDTERKIKISVMHDSSPDC